MLARHEYRTWELDKWAARAVVRWWGGAHKTADPGKTGTSGQADTRKKPASADKTNATATDKKE